MAQESFCYVPNWARLPGVAGAPGFDKNRCFYNQGGVMKTKKIFLPESEIPRQWYNIQADQ